MSKLTVSRIIHLQGQLKKKETSDDNMMSSSRNLCVCSSHVWCGFGTWLVIGGRSRSCGSEAGGKASPPLWNMVADIPLSLQPGSHWRLTTLAASSGHVPGRPNCCSRAEPDRRGVRTSGRETPPCDREQWLDTPRETIQERAEVQLEAAGGVGGGGGGGKAAESLANSDRLLEDVRHHRRPGWCWRAKNVPSQKKL